MGKDTGGDFVNYCVFLPWKQEKGIERQSRQHLYFYPEKEPHLFSVSCIHYVKKPFFSMPNPRGTLQFFIDALKRNADEEAKGYICKALIQFVDMEEMRSLFEGENQYQYFLSKQNQEIRTVTIAIQSKIEKKQMLAVQMIEEPDLFGKWKICRIEKH